MTVLPVPGRSETVFVDIEKIICFEGIDGYTNVYVEDAREEKGWKKFLVTETLKIFERRFIGLGFPRVNKQYVINLCYLEIHQHDNLLKLRIDCCENIYLTRTYFSVFKQKLKSMSV